MAIVGIETILYGVDDVEECTRYFVDFGLPMVKSDAGYAHFRLPEGSNVVIRDKGDSAIPKSELVGTGVHETIWGVDTAAALEELVADLVTDRVVTRDDDGTAHFLDDSGLAHGLRLYRKSTLYSAPDPVNSPGNINRINQHRKWITQARPKTIQHVVFQVPDPQNAWAFFRDRLNFRLSDDQRNFGLYARADGTNDHHNIFFMNGHLPFPGFDGKSRFNHVNYGVDDVDEIMVGANYMERQGWPKSAWGLGRHRIASSLFMYLPCPTGGDAEYGADSDYVDDSWIPRVWNPMFGFFSFVHNMAHFMLDAAPWEVEYKEGYTPPTKEGGPPSVGPPKD